MLGLTPTYYFMFTEEYQKIYFSELGKKWSRKKMECLDKDSLFGSSLPYIIHLDFRVTFPAHKYNNVTPLLKN